MSVNTCAFLKRVLRHIGILDSSPNTKNGEIYRKIVVGVTFTLDGVNICSTAWFYLHHAQTTAEAAESVFYFLYTIQVLSWYSNCLWHRQRYAALFKDLEAIIEKRSSNRVSRAIYLSTKNKVETRSQQIYLWIFQVSAHLFMFAPILWTIFKLLFDASSFEESYRLMWAAKYPFDCGTPVGYTGCILIQMATVHFKVNVVVCVILLTFGFCSFAASFVTDLEQILRELNIELIANKKRKLNYRQQIEMCNKLTEFIQFHSVAREFTICFSDINTGIVSVFLTFILSSFGYVGLQVQTFIHSGEIAGIFQISIVILCNLSVLYLFCHYGNLVTQRNEEVANGVYNVSWRLLPLDRQKQIPMIIAMSQRRVYVRGYADIRSTYQLFMQILKKKFFYFLIIFAITYLK